MIERIEIATCASYGNTSEVMNDLSTFNFVYGPNGSGKTTISRVIADEGQFPTCGVRWAGATKLQTLVYNRDFVQANFNQPTGLKGIFTLGEKNIEVLQKISEVKQQIDDMQADIDGLNNTLEGVDGPGGKRAELGNVEADFKEACWNLKKKHDAKLQGALVGCRGDAQKFKERILSEAAANTAEVRAQAELEQRAKTVYGTTPTPYATIPALVDTAFLELEVNPILKKRVLGKTDVDIAGMIQKLGNSDWVKQGVPYFEINNNKCPFCQQMAPAQLGASLAKYFDDAFETDSVAIVGLKSDFQLEGEHLQHALQEAINSASQFLDIDKLKTEKSLFDAKFQTNLQRIENKRKEPSQLVELESMASVTTAAKKLISDANEKITAHNLMVGNLSIEKQTLTQQIWKFLVDVEVRVSLADYKKKKAGIEAAISSLEGKIATARKEMAAKTDELRQLEKGATSIQPTVNAINRLLTSFGFRSFSLATTADGKYYSIRRPDGTDAKNTLSEGEYSFISFLYFFHLLKGSDSSSGITTNRVVVFDDPVSSLDSDILFVVGGLIKSLCQEVRNKTGTVKQVFVLTHNVYFHKEVTFNPKRTSGVLNEETFWTVSKFHDVSHLKRHGENPIKTSYELLWAEVRSPLSSSQTLQNTLRRILESYFRILGNIDSDEIVFSN